MDSLEGHTVLVPGPIASDCLIWGISESLVFIRNAGS